MSEKQSADASTLNLREDSRPGDREGIEAIVTATGFFTPAEIEVAIELFDERESKGPASGYHFVFAERAARLIGYACFGPIPCTQHSYDLYWIAVHPETQGRGLGRAILAAAERAIRERGGKRVYIETSSRAQYRDTRGFYTRTGYELEATLRDFYAPGDDKAIYSRALSPTD